MASRIGSSSVALVPYTAINVYVKVWRLTSFSFEIFYFYMEKKENFLEEPKSKASNDHSKQGEWWEYVSLQEQRVLF